MFTFKDIDKVNNVNNINRARKLKSSSLIIGFNKNSKINCLEVNIKLIWNDNIYLLL